MQNRTDQSNEGLSGEFSVPDQTLELGRKIYSRYGNSPGLISLGLGPGWARRVVQFSDRLPLLHILRQRWSQDRLQFPISTSPLWFRVFAPSKSVEQPSPGGLSIVHPALQGSQAGISAVELSASNFGSPQGSSSCSRGSKVEADSGHAVPPGPAGQIHLPTRSAMDRVSRVHNASTPLERKNLTENHHGIQAEAGGDVRSGSAPAPADMAGSPVLRAEPEGDKAVRTRVSTEVTEAIGPTASPLTVQNGTTLPPSRASSESCQVTMMREPGSTTAAAGMIGKSSSASTSQVQRKAESKLSFQTTTAAPTAGASSQVPQSSPGAATRESSNSLTVEGSQGVKVSHPSQAQVGPPIFWRQAGALSRTKQQSAGSPETYRAGGSPTIDSPSKASKPESRPASRMPSQEMGVFGGDRKATDVRRAMTPRQQEVILTNGLQPQAIVGKQNSVTDSGALPAAEKTFEHSDLRLSPARFRDPDQAPGEGAVVVGEYSSAKPIGESTALPLVQRRETVFVSPPRESSKPGIAAESVSRRVELLAGEAVSRASKGDTVALSVGPSAAPRADVDANQPRGTGLPGDCGSNLMQRSPYNPIRHQGERDIPPIVQRQATVLPSHGTESSSARTTTQGASQPMDSPTGKTVIPALNSDGVSSNQPSGTGSPAFGVTSSLVPMRMKSSAEHQERPLAPLFVQRIETILRSPQNESFDAGTAEVAPHRYESPAGQPRISALKPDGVLSAGSSATGSADAILNQPVGTGSLASSLGSTLVQRHTDSLITRRGKFAARASEAQETPVVRPRFTPAASLEARSVVLARKKIQPQGGGGGTLRTEVLPQIMTSPTQGVRCARTEEQTTTAAMDEVPTISKANPAQSQSPERGVFPDAGSAIPVLRRTARETSSGDVMGYPPAGKGSVSLSGSSDIRYPTWRRTDMTSTQSGINHGVTRSAANLNVVQRSAAVSPSNMGVQTPAALPSLPDGTRPTSQALPSGDLTQLANRVYELLVRRLASEKQQRGT